MEASRRDFINVAIGGMGVIGALGVLYPIVKTLASSAASTTEAKVEVDVSKVPELGVRVTSYKGKPLFVLKLPKDLTMEKYKVKKDLVNSAGKLNYDLLKGHNVFALIGVCTHLGCIPLWKPEGSEDVKAPYLHCPCHGGLYTPWGDNVGGPPPRPLFVPPQKLEGSKLVVGEPGFVDKLV
ncbi:MAG: ubiquinol-cytochrome c reductase iron-sulfur subunit [Aquificota bacterium]|nr:ubiquinol-cytochrome c reductase iron-sulfur subunit [Aquificota bacterium]